MASALVVPLLTFDAYPVRAQGGDAAGGSGASGSSLAGPSVGRLGGFSFPYNAIAPLLGTPGAAWSIVPSLGVQLLASDNIFASSRNRETDVVTAIDPGLFLSGDSQRLRGTLAYVPSAQFYANNSNQNRVFQVGSGQATATLVQDQLFLDVRGLAAVQPTAGGFAPNGNRPATSTSTNAFGTTGQAGVPTGLQDPTGLGGAANPGAAGFGGAANTSATGLGSPGSNQLLTRSNSVQSYSFQVSPYFVQRFGSLATVRLGYVYQFSDQTGTEQRLPNQSLPFFVGQSVVSNRGYAVVRSGEDLGRLALQGRVDATTYSGGGVYAGAQNFVTSVEARYAILPTVALLVEGGYEDVSFGGLTPIRISDAIWSLGTRLTPGPESAITARYVRRYGFNSPSLSAVLAVGGRTQIFANYSESFSTAITNAQDLLASTTLDALGNPVDSQTGEPVLYVNSFFPVQNAVFKSRVGSATISQFWPRDTISLSIFSSEQTPVSVARGTTAFAFSSVVGGITWSHELTPLTTGIVSAQLGRSNSSGAGSGSLYAISGALIQQFTETLTGTFRVSWTRSVSGISLGSYSQGVVVLGLRKTF